MSELNCSNNRTSSPFVEHPIVRKNEITCSIKHQMNSCWACEVIQNSQVRETRLITTSINKFCFHIFSDPDGHKNGHVICEGMEEAKLFLHSCNLQKREWIDTNRTKTKKKAWKTNQKLKRRRKEVCKKRQLV